MLCSEDTPLVVQKYAKEPVDENCRRIKEQIDNGKWTHVRRADIPDEVREELDKYTERARK